MIKCLENVLTLRVWLQLQQDQFLPAMQIFRLSLYDETKIASALSQVAEECSKSGVSVGSYPVRVSGYGSEISGRQ